MSKIDEYKAQRSRTKSVVTALRAAQGLKADGTKDPQNDKHTIEFYASPLWDSDVPCFLHASYGYYGSSSGYTACGDETRVYIYQALDEYKEAIVNRAIELAQEAEKKALLECKGEAEKVLEMIKKMEENCK